MARKIEIAYPEKMRYPTVGDYFEMPDGRMRFEVLDTGNEFTNRLILIHELIEQTLCEQAGISEEAITFFDVTHPDSEDPGDLRDAPYRDQHNLATAVERMMCALAGISWQEHDQRVLDTFKRNFGDG